MASTFCDGITRRAVLQIGAAGFMGLTLPNLLRLEARAKAAEPGSQDYVDPGNKPAPTRSVIYKEVGDIKLKLHIFEPQNHKSSDKRPAIVFFHGGAYKGGSPNQFYWQAAYLASRGMVAFSAQYRLTTQGVEVKDGITDGKSVIRWVRKHAGELGVDPNRIAAGGGSAGGHLAAATDVLKTLDEKTEDLTVSSRPDLLILFNPALFHPAEQKTLSLDDFTKDMRQAIFMFGSKDKEMIKYATDLRLKRAGPGGWSDKFKIYIAEGVGHGFFNGPPWRERSAYLMDQFLAEHGYTKGEPTLKLDGGIQMEQLK